MPLYTILHSYYAYSTVRLSSSIYSTSRFANFERTVIVSPTTSYRAGSQLAVCLMLQSWESQISVGYATSADYQ